MTNQTSCGACSTERVIQGNSGGSTYKLHMKRVLLTGMSGTGKSTVIARLGELGYKVVDSDYGGFTVEVDSGTGRERLWREDRIQEV